MADGIGPKLTLPQVDPVPSFAEIERVLRDAYGQPLHHNKREPLAELVFILLSTQTREAEYRRTFSTLWQRYRSWDRVRRAPCLLYTSPSPRDS